MNRLLEIGFVQVGRWYLVNEKLTSDLARHATQQNVLYAFVCDGDIKYIGKSKMSLAARMSGYRNPAESQTTNVRNNKRIREVLAEGGAVDIYALPDSGLLHYGRFHLNLAAGLEDDLIRVIDPPWNGGRKEVPADTPEALVPLEEAYSSGVATQPASTPSTAIPAAAASEGIHVGGPLRVRTFTFVLHPTYHRTGFFNVGVAAEAHLGGDGDIMEIFVGDVAQPILATINRTANRNGTPRIMGGTGLRDWFQAVADPMDTFDVYVLSPTAIRLSRSR